MTRANNQYDNLLEAINNLRSEGYTVSFNLTQGGLTCSETKETYKPGDINILEFHRIEGSTDFEDMSIIYGIETSSGIKGIIIDAFGTYADTELGEFLRKTKFKDE
ncbi:MAG: phosphoribosylpyrophosphate synthetase [Deltaproteobacteria bacterium]|nr:MAG: phosphoribosylpyrophosphate synthetase [Deltaproteobacteria bacterium]